MAGQGVALPALEEEDLSKKRQEYLDAEKRRLEKN